MISYSTAYKYDIALPEGLLGRVWHYYNQGHQSRLHQHPELEMNYVLKGRAIYLLGNRRYEMTEGSLVWLFPGQNHLLTQKSADLEMWIAVFHPRLLRACCRQKTSAKLCEIDPSGHFYKHLRPSQTRRLTSLFQSVAETSESLDHYNAGLAYVLLTAWEAYLKADQVPNGNNIHPAVQRAAHLLRQDTERTPIGEIARQAGLSASRLSDVFKQETGTTLVEFRNRHCLERFLTIYEPGQRKTMLEVALEVGFGSYLQFYRIFRQVMGYSPAEYRRQKR